MSIDFPPLHLPVPQITRRRKERPRVVPVPPEVLARREAIAQRLRQQIRPLSRELREMTEEQRRAVFFKIEHEGAVPLAGTDLRPIHEPTDRFTLAAPRSDSLDRLDDKISEFGSGALRRGRAPNQQLATRMKRIDRGKPEDRLSQVLYDGYEELIRSEWVICEIEMISLEKGRKQRRRELSLIRAELLATFGNGVHGQFFEHEEIKGTCRAVIRCTGAMFRRLVEEQRWQRRIIWFDAKPEFETFSSTLRDFNFAQLGELVGPEDDASVVCIVDSGVTPGNPFLQPVAVDGLQRSFLERAPDSPFDQHGHGSGVASLVSYYVLNIARGGDNRARIWIASARVLDSSNQMEEERLFSMVLAEVVDTFEPLGVRIFNLSVNIINRKWTAEAKRTVPRKSWVARTIDRLSQQRDVVFVVSTGNVGTLEVREYLASGHAYPDYLCDEDARILDPGQAALALTIGAIAPTTIAIGPSAQAMAIAERGQPAPFTRSGPGMNGEIKPELVEYGGNYLHDPDAGLVRANPGLDVLMASHRLTPAIAHDSGTSFAAARASHKLALVLADLSTLGTDHVSAPLLRAFAVNAAGYAELGDEFRAFKEAMGTAKGGRELRWLNVVGYGVADAVRATHCDQHSAILFYQGQLRPDSVAFFDVPVATGLAEAEGGTKRLTVTVAYAPEVQRWGLETYLGTTFKWRMFRGDVLQDDIIDAMAHEEEREGRADSDSGEQPQRPSELKGTLGLMRRSRGTVQHDVIEWERHRESYSAGNYTLAVAAYERWRRANPGPVRYGVVVRLEDTSRSTKVYAETQGILATVEAQVQATS